MVCKELHTVRDLCQWMLLRVCTIAPGLAYRSCAVALVLLITAACHPSCCWHNSLGKHETAVQARQQLLTPLQEVCSCLA